MATAVLMPIIVDKHEVQVLRAVEVGPEDRVEIATLLVLVDDACASILEIVSLHQVTGPSPNTPVYPS